MNWGCESCGGVQPDAPIPLDWQGRTLMDNVDSDADFVGGAGEILICAC